MRAVTLERSTRRLVALWTLATSVLSGATTLVAIAAGGESEWTRWVLGAVSIAGLVAATRFHIALHVGVIAGALMLAVVPHDATLDRGAVAAVGALLLLLAAESAHVARRLITIAPIRSSRRDAAAIARLAMASGLALGTAAAIAQLDRWGNRTLVLGLGLACLAVLALLGGADDELQTS